jgi:hypothetical protein
LEANPCVSSQRAVLGVFLVLLGLYTACFTGLPDNPDAEVEFQTVSSLCRNGTLALAGTAEADALLAARFGVASGGPARAHESFAWFGVGQAYVAVPFYGVGRVLALAFPGVQQRATATSDYGVARSEYFEHLAVGWRNSLLGALTGALVAALALHLGAQRGGAVLAGLSYGLCSFALAQARSTLSDVQATFFLALALHQLVAARSKTLVHANSVVHALACGLALGLCVLTRVAVAPAAACIGLAAFVALPNARARVALIVPAALCGALFAWTNHARFGNWLETGYGAGVSGSFFSYPPHLGLAGLLIAPSKGLVWLAPAVFLAPFAWRPLVARVGKLSALLVALALFAVLAPITCMPGWHAAWTFGPRYLLPLLPLAWIGVAFALERPRAGRVAGVLLAFGCAMNAPAALIDTLTHHDFALQSSRALWRFDASTSERDADEQRFLNLQWEPRTTASLGHARLFLWRLQHPEREPSGDELYGFGGPEPLIVHHERDRGFRHLAWVWQRDMLGAPAWPIPLLAAALVAAGLLALRRRGPSPSPRDRPPAQA